MTTLRSHSKSEAKAGARTGPPDSRAGALGPLLSQGPAQTRPADPGGLAPSPEPRRRLPEHALHSGRLRFSLHCLWPESPSPAIFSGSPGHRQIQLAFRVHGYLWDVNGQQRGGLLGAALWPPSQPRPPGTQTQQKPEGGQNSDAPTAAPGAACWRQTASPDGCLILSQGQGLRGHSLSARPSGGGPWKTALDVFSREWGRSQLGISHLSLSHGGGLGQWAWGRGFMETF